jgi:hypothetical protein
MILDDVKTDYPYENQHSSHEDAEILRLRKAWEEAKNCTEFFPLDPEDIIRRGMERLKEDATLY